MNACEMSSERSRNCRLAEIVNTKCNASAAGVGLEIPKALADTREWRSLATIRQRTLEADFQADTHLEGMILACGYLFFKLCTSYPSAKRPALHASMLLTSSTMP